MPSPRRPSPEPGRYRKCFGKDDFLYTDRVAATISAKGEYMIYRKALSEVILKRPELEGADIKRILHAREEGLKLLRANLHE